MQNLMPLCASGAHFPTHAPVDSDGGHGVDAGEYGCNGEKVVEAAVP